MKTEDISMMSRHSESLNSFNSGKQTQILTKFCQLFSFKIHSIFIFTILKMFFFINIYK